MVAQDVNTRTKAEIEAAAMTVLIEVIGRDDDSNIAKTLDACKIKDPSLIMSINDDEIGELIRVLTYEGQTRCSGSMSRVHEKTRQPEVMKREREGP